MDLSAGMLVASLVIGSIGFGLFLYGKKQLRMPQFVVGLAMMIYPYFVSNLALTWILAGVLSLALAIAVRMGM